MTADSRFLNIPEELRQLPQWVNWRIEQREGRSMKVPKQPSGVNASSTAPKTWSTFERVTQTNRQFNGIGFVFTKETGYVGIDLDKCRDPKTGETEKWALDIIKKLDSYTELSQSGTGWHMIVKGGLPPGGNRKGRMEMYDSERYFCMTGALVPGIGRGTIEARDIADLQKRMLAGEFGSPSSKAKRAKDDSASAEDFRLIGEVQKQVRTSDPAVLEEAFRTQYPERYAERNCEKDDRAGKNYFRYSIEKFLARNHSAAGPVGRIPITETSNAERFVKKYRDETRFCSDRKVWCAWDGSIWAVNDIGGVMRRILEVSRGIYLEAANEQDESLRKALGKWAKESESRRTQENSTAIARWLDGIEVPRFSEVFDRHPLLLNVKNATIDLQTGVLSPHRREDFLTKMVTIEYDAKAVCPRFSKFLNDTLPGAGLVGYLLRFAGYCLTGLTSEQSWFMFYGVTASGKSTLINVLRGLLGPYALALPENYFLVTKNTSDFATANLAGVRLATCVETNEGKRLDVAKIKSLTGEDVIAAALKYENYFNFKPQAKLVLATNHRPRIPATDDSIWRRVKVVPFNVTVPEEKRIPDLATKLLEDEGPGILRWAVLGCQSFLVNRLDEPEAVKSAVNEYRTDEDIVQNFLDECCVSVDSAKVARKELFAEYVRWAKDKGFHYLFSAKKIAIELARLGITGDEGNRYWLGVRIERYTPTEAHTREPGEEEAL
jgi:putative DNA primase/helicase